MGKAIKFRMRDGIPVFIAVAALVAAYGYAPRKQHDCEDCTHGAEAGRTMSETYRLGPEDHPGFQDPIPEDEIESQLQKALHVLEYVESGGDPNAIGDLDRKNKAYGVLQIRKPYLDDVNRLFGDEIQERWGKARLSMSEMKEPSKARWVTENYLTHYGAAYARKTGLEPTVTTYTRIHNGGPLGWRRDATNDHTRKVEQAIEKMEEGKL